MSPWRDFVSTGIVATLASAFGSAMLIAARMMADVAAATGVTRFGSLTVVLTVITVVFLLVALSVSSVVTANTCSTVIAGQTRLIALERLIGASSARSRSRIVQVGLLVGALGATAGTALAVLLGAIALVVLHGTGAVPPGQYSVWSPALLLPAFGVVLTIWGAYHVGSRRVLAVRPLQALSSVVEPRPEDVAASRLRTAIALSLLILGCALLALGVIGYEFGAEMVFVAMAGGFVSFSGFAIGAPTYLPPILALVGRVGARHPAVLLAGRNVLRTPARAARATIGLVIGVTLVVTISTALSTFEHQVVEQWDLPRATLDATRSAFAMMDSIAGVLGGFSAVIAAVGVINAVALGVLQRQREIALLRAIGLSARQVRAMVIVEALQMVLTALIVGVLLGTVYGWAGAVALFGFKTTGAPIVPVLPPTTLLIVASGGLVLATAASIGPLRHVLRVSPTAALAID